MFKKLIKAGSIVFLGMLFGRLSGFFRESLIAARFGASEEADLVILILTIPDFLLNILVGGAMGAVLIPEFKRLKFLSFQMFLQANIVVLLIFTLLTIALSLNADWLVYLFAPGLEHSQSSIEKLLKISLWSIPLTALASVTTAFLQANDRFAIPALGTLIYNSILIIALFFSASHSLVMITYAIILASLLRWGAQIMDFMPLGLKRFRIISNYWLLNKKLIIRYIQALLSAGIILFFPIITRSLASFEESGSIAILNYSNKLVELPLGTFITIFSIVLFPKLASLFSKNNSYNQAMKLSQQSLFIVFIISISFTVNFLFFSDIYSRILFGWGEMSQLKIKEIAVLTSICVLSLPAQGITSITQIILNSKKDTKNPFYISLIALILFLFLAWLLRIYLGLIGIVSSLVFIHYVILFGHLFILKYKHQIDFIKVVFSLENLFVIFICLFSVLPFIFLNNLISNIFIQLSLSAFSLLLIISTSFLVNKSHRKLILSKFKGR